ncbi:hypothetical protein DVH24_042423 [Malus domestica]|uniref:Pectinesterase catalytic domain-containing protein n=1 Tax=Malus domestica TaxID=3750 RepID=A0A498J2X4_MALDO|nr:hypothetical protein DVH24_042423 [Malus domestica]
MTVIVEKQMTNVVMIGDGSAEARATRMLKTILLPKGTGFKNTSGHVKHQAMTLRVQSDFFIFFNCHMDAYQDTLYTQPSPLCKTQCSPSYR